MRALRMPMTMQSDRQTRPLSPRPLSLVPAHTPPSHKSEAVGVKNIRKKKEFFLHLVLSYGYRWVMLLCRGVGRVPHDRKGGE